MKKFFFLLLGVIFISLLFNSFKIGDSKIGYRLEYLLESTQQNYFVVYIYFSDKGTDALLKLQNPSSLVTQRSLDRRSKVLHANQLVEFADIPLNENYVNEISQNVEKVRQQIKWFNALSVEATREEISDIEKLDFVKKIELVESYIRKEKDIEKRPVKIIQINPPKNNILTDSLNYGPGLTQISQINVNLVHDQGIFGQGV